MKSIAIRENSRCFSGEIGWSGGQIGWRLILCCWQIAQPSNSQPPVIPLDEDLSGKASGVSRGYGIMVFLYHITAESEVVGYITSVFVEN